MEIWHYDVGIPSLIVLSYVLITGALYAVAGVAPAGSSVQRQASFWARMAGATAVLMVCASYGIVASLVLKPLGKAGLAQWMVARAFKWTMYPVTGVWFEVVEGHEHLQQRPAVFIGNHQSELDILFLGVTFPKWCSVTAKASLKWMPFLGQFMALSNTVFIDRANREAAFKAFERAARHMRDERQSVFIFAEGTRSYFDKPDLLPFKKGAFHLAIQAQVPIVPIVAANYSYVLNVKRRIFRPGTVPVKVLPPVSTKGLTAKDVDRLCHDTREDMLKTIVELAQDQKEKGGSTTIAEAVSTGVDVGRKPVANAL